MENWFQFATGSTCGKQLTLLLGLTATPERLLSDRTWTAWKAAAGLVPAPADPDLAVLGAAVARACQVTGPGYLGAIRALPAGGLSLAGEGSAAANIWTPDGPVPIPRSRFAGFFRRRTPHLHSLAAGTPHARRTARGQPRRRLILNPSNSRCLKIPKYPNQPDRRLSGSCAILFSSRQIFRAGIEVRNHGNE